MPEISRFFGMVIAIYHNDHTPPHFHVRYGSQKASILIDPPKLDEGRLSAKALSLVLEWAESHRDELRANWELKPLSPIQPLE